MVQEKQGMAAPIQDDEGFRGKAWNTGFVIKRRNIYIGQVPAWEDKERGVFGLTMKNLSINFKQYKKYQGKPISLFIASGRKKFVVAISYVFSPFNDMLIFFEDLLRRKNSKFMIDEEGRIKDFIAKKFDKNGDFNFILKDHFKKDALLEVRCNNNGFVSEFINKLKLFLDKEFKHKLWDKDIEIPYQKINKLSKLLKNLNT